MSKPVVYAIADLHMPGIHDKTMDIFGERWEGHVEKIVVDWQEKVKADDVVLIPGDISWAMTLDEVQNDLELLGQLPGKTVLLKGNHDFWWSSISRLRLSLPDGIYAIQNDAIKIGEYIFCGSRGWIYLPESPEDEKIYKRELKRLELSLKSMQRIRENEQIIALLHFPPTDATGADSAITSLLENYQVDQVVYGHLHGQSAQMAFSGSKNGVVYHFVACDALDFRLLKL